MHLILTGATGLVGATALRAMLVNPKVSKISILSRRPVPQAEGHEKANVIIHKDFENYDHLKEQLSGAKGVVWALGISQNLVSKEEYIRITKDYTLAFASFLSTLPTPPTFVWVSGEGVTHKPGRFTPIFGRTKGEVELKLLSLATSAPPTVLSYAVRPGGVDPSAQPDIQPYIPAASGVMGAIRGPVLFGAMKVLTKSMYTPTKELGEVLVDLALSDGAPLEGEGIESDGRVVRNTAVRRLGGLS